MNHNKIIDKKKYLNPDVISRLDNMMLRARYTVEGFIIRLHKSPYQGFSVEFAEHKPYMPGDEIKRIDWKLFGKTDRYFIKEYEEETNLKSYILLDRSGSMGYTSGTITKLDYGSFLAAALSYLMLKQQDAVSLATVDKKIHSFLPPVAKTSHLNLVLNQLENTKPGEETEISAILHEMAEKIKKRGLIILISDLMDDSSKIMSALKHFRYKGHEVIVFHILDKNELEFNFSRQTKFIDLENNNTIITEPQHIQNAYRESISQFINDYKYECRKNNIDYTLLTTDKLLHIGLTEYLNKRSKIG